MKIYTYQGCSTCKAAVKWLRAHSISFEEVAIRETPPSLKELQAMLQAYEGQLPRLFNTSGQDYRALGMKDKLPSLSVDEALNLLSSHGNLVKRPFLIDTARKVHRVGFKESEWAQDLATAAPNSPSK
jgi:arsenate reductase (glutaredoxin)